MTTEEQRQILLTIQQVILGVRKRTFRSTPELDYVFDEIRDMLDADPNEQSEAKEDSK